MITGCPIQHIATAHEGSAVLLTVDYEIELGDTVLMRVLFRAPLDRVNGDVLLEAVKCVGRMDLGESDVVELDERLTYAMAADLSGDERVMRAAESAWSDVAAQSKDG